MKSRFSVTLITILMIWAAPLTGEEYSPSPCEEKAKYDPELLQKVLDGFEEAQLKTLTLTASFIQEKKLELMDEKITSRGNFWYTKPDLFLWEYSEPDDITLLINHDELITWYKDLKEATRLNIHQKRKRVFKYFAINEDMETLKKHFIIELGLDENPVRNSYHLRLIPKRKRIRNRLSMVEMWIDRDLLMPVQIVYSEPDGDYTKYTFENLTLNKEIDPSMYELRLPEDVSVKEVTPGHPTGEDSIVLDKD